MCYHLTKNVLGVEDCKWNRFIAMMSTDGKNINKKREKTNRDGNMVSLFTFIADNCFTKVGRKIKAIFKGTFIFLKLSNKDIR